MIDKTKEIPKPSKGNTEPWNSTSDNAAHAFIIWVPMALGKPASTALLPET